MYKTITWNTGSAAARFRLKKNKKIKKVSKRASGGWARKCSSRVDKRWSLV